MIHRSYSMIDHNDRRSETFLALQDAMTLARQHDSGIRLIGGLMVELLTRAFPAAGFIQRGTVDVDLALTPELAASGDVHRRLVDLGYTATSGNNYQKGARSIDLLVPTFAGEFKPEQLGDRMFDAMPGISIVLGAEPIMHDIELIWTAEATARLAVPTPTVEGAVILKAITAQSRIKPEDIFDLYNLLSIKDHYSESEIGPWRLGEGELKGARRDAVRAMRSLLGMRLIGTAPYLDRSRFDAMIRKHVAVDGETA